MVARDYFIFFPYWGGGEDGMEQAEYIISTLLSRMLRPCQESEMINSLIMKEKRDVSELLRLKLQKNVNQLIKLCHRSHRDHVVSKLFNAWEYVKEKNKKKQEKKTEKKMVCTKR